MPGKRGHLVSLIFTPISTWEHWGPERLNNLSCTYKLWLWRECHLQNPHKDTHCPVLPSSYLGCTASVPHMPGPSSYCLSFHSPRSRAPIVIINFVYTFLPLPVSQPLPWSAFLAGRWQFRWVMEVNENFQRAERKGGKFQEEEAVYAKAWTYKQQTCV